MITTYTHLLIYKYENLKNGGFFPLKNRKGTFMAKVLFGCYK